MTDVASPPDIDQLTVADLEGSGVFDVLMRATKSHLIEEYDSGRIDGTQYSDVYVGALGAVLQQSVAYLLNHENSRKISAEIDLIGQQIVTELANTDNSISGAVAEGYGFNDDSDIQGIIEAGIKKTQIETDLTEQKLVTELGQSSDVKPVDLGQNPSVNIDGLIATKRVIDEKQADLLELQKSASEAETDLVGQKIITELASTSDNIGPGTELGYGLNTSSAIEGLLKSTLDRSAMDTDLVEQKLVTELGQTSDTKPLTLGQNETTTEIEGLVAAKKALEEKQGTLVDSQKIATDAEKDLTGQRIATELANTGDDLAAVRTASYGFNIEDTIRGLVESKLAKEAMEADLTEQKIVSELGQSSDTKPMTLGQNKTSESIDGLIASKKAVEDLQADLVSSQVSVADAEKALTGQKIISELAQTGEDLSNAKAAGYGFNDTGAVEGLLKSAIDKSTLEEDLLEQKIVTELGQTSRVKPLDLGKISATTIDGLVKSQTDKAAHESVLLAQKAITELAQTSDSVPTDTDALNDSAVVTGYINKQKLAYDAQTSGFARDAEQKLAKMMIDAWSVNETMGDGTGRLSTNALDDSSLGSVINKAKTGIGA